MALIDRDVLRQLAADLQGEDFQLVLQTFRTDTERLGAGLDAAGRVGDVAAWRRAAHALAGAAAAVGAVGVEQLARQAMAHPAIDPDTAARVMAEIHTAIENTLNALHASTDAGTVKR